MSLSHIVRQSKSHKKNYSFSFPIYLIPFFPQPLVLIPVGGCSHCKHIINFFQIWNWVEIFSFPTEHFSWSVGSPDNILQSTKPNKVSFQFFIDVVAENSCSVANYFHCRSSPKSFISFSSHFALSNCSCYLFQIRSRKFDGCKVPKNWNKPIYLEIPKKLSRKTLENLR